MKNVVKILVFVFMIIVVSAQSQDFILKLNVGINKQYCENISISNDTINFLNINDNEESVILIDDIYGMHFYKDKPDELLLLSFQIDTIECTIDSISKKDIFYRDTNRLRHSIEISDVFCILFDKNISTQKIESYYNQFLLLQKQNYKNSQKLIKQDGTKIDISVFNSLTNDTIDVQITSKHKTINTYANINTLDSYIKKEPVDRMKMDYFREFILSKEEAFKEVSINRLVNNMVNFSLVVNNEIITLEQNKKLITGIFFYNYDNTVIQIIEEDLPIEKKQKAIVGVIKQSESKLTFDVSPGFGYMLNVDKAFDLPIEDEAYLNKLRKGFSFDANLRMFVTNEFGIGIKYNYFHTSEKIEDKLSQNISVKFIGGTLFGNLPIMKNRGIFNVDLSLGLLTKKEYFELDKEPYNIRGNTVGVYVSVGIEYFVFKNITLGINFGLLGGNLEKVDINSDYNIILDKPNSLSRFDGLVKIKAYL